jgi:glycerol-3-phosphate acyltransferase PlsY
MKKEAIAVMLILGGGVAYLIGSLNREVQLLKNENRNLSDLNVGQEDTIRLLNYSLGKKRNYGKG